MSETTDGVDEAASGWEEMEHLPFLHLYAQYQWHDSATIRGTKTALTALRDALDKALSDGEATASVTATDGEGYGINVVRCNLVASVGSPEYLYALEFEMGKRAAEREREFRLAVKKSA